MKKFKKKKLKEREEIRKLIQGEEVQTEKWKPNKNASSTKIFTAAYGLESFLTLLGCWLPLRNNHVLLERSRSSFRLSFWLHNNGGHRRQSTGSKSIENDITTCTQHVALFSFGGNKDEKFDRCSPPLIGRQVRIEVLMNRHRYRMNARSDWPCPCWNKAYSLVMNMFTPWIMLFRANSF